MTDTLLYFAVVYPGLGVLVILVSQFIQKLWLSADAIQKFLVEVHDFSALPNSLQKTWKKHHKCKISRTDD